MQEEQLSGGNVNRVVRVGDSVRRMTGPWSDSVHALLRHLEAQGFEHAPRFLGIDEQGREILSYIEGEVGFEPYIWSEESLVAAARLLRRYHDATTFFAAPVSSNWQWQHPDAARHEVICQHDFAPYNIVCRNQTPYALIDFDFAGPGPRVWDVAMGVYWFTPLSFSSDLTALSQRDMDAGSRRFHLFCSTYGIEPTCELLDTVEERLRFLVNLIQARAAAGEVPWQKMIAEGHLTHWTRELEAYRRVRPRLGENLAP